MTTETEKRLNAIRTCKSILKDSGIQKAEFYLDNLPEEKVISLAHETKSHLHPPSITSPHYWCVIWDGNFRIHFHSIDNENLLELKTKEVEILKALEPLK